MNIIQYIYIFVCVCIIYTPCICSCKIHICTLICWCALPLCLHSFAWANKHVFDCRIQYRCISIAHTHTHKSEYKVCVFTVILYLPKGSILIMLQSVSLCGKAIKGIPLLLMLPQVLPGGSSFYSLRHTHAYPQAHTHTQREGDR